MSDDQWFNAIRRFVDHLPRTEDTTLVILKGHLLIEALLREVIDLKVGKPKALKEASLEFFQCACIAEAIYAKQMPTWLWVALRKLNSIRNLLAHNIEPLGVQDKIKDFVTYVEEHRDKSPGLRSLAKGEPLKLALGDVHSQLLLIHARESEEA
jgi:hypothetical protein